MIEREPQIAFITYTKAAVQYVTSPEWETHFLDWLNSVDDSSSFKRATHAQVGVKCSPATVHAETKRATILNLVKKDAE